MSSAHTSAQPQPDQPAAADPTPGDQLSVTGSWPRLLNRIAKTLGEAELRLFLALWDLQQDNPRGLRINTRDLAKASGISKSNLLPAVKQLGRLCYLTHRAGDATTKGFYRICAFDTIQISGPATGPLTAENSGPEAGPLPQQVVLFQDQSGPFSGPPPTENKTLQAAAARVEISTETLMLIDQVLSAKSSTFDPHDVETFRRWLHSYMQKFGRSDDNRPIGNGARPPKDDLVAQFLSLAPPKRLATFLDNLMLEQQTCRTYGWFITTGLQRIHGIHFQETKKARAALAIVKAGAKPDTHPPDFAGQLALDLAKRKAMP